MLLDVYDGRIWQQFMQVLTTSTRLALMLMWIGFSYVHTCSVGVVFLTIMNLPHITGPLWSWFQAYLTKRYHYVTSATFGVPQGSILGQYGGSYSFLSI